MGYYWIPIKGKVNRGCRLIISNHTSTLDIMYLFWLYSCSFVAAEFVRTKPVLRKVAKLDMVVIVNRLKGGHLEEVKKMIRRRVDDKRYPPVALFPEGSTSNGTHVTHFFQGAFAPGLPIHPLIFKHHFIFSDPTWSLYHVLRLCVLQFAQLFSAMSVVSLPVYHPSPAEIDHPHYYAWNLQHVMARAGGLGVSDLTLREKNAWEKLRDHIPLRKQPKVVDVRPGIAKHIQEYTERQKEGKPNSQTEEGREMNGAEEFDEYTYCLFPFVSFSTQSLVLSFSSMIVFLLTLLRHSPGSYGSKQQRFLFNSCPPPTRYSGVD